MASRSSRKNRGKNPFLEEVNVVERPVVKRRERVKKRKIAPEEEKKKEVIEIADDQELKIQGAHYSWQFIAGCFDTCEWHLKLGEHPWIEFNSNALDAFTDLSELLGFGTRKESGDKASFTIHGEDNVRLVLVGTIPYLSEARRRDARYFLAGL